MTYTKTEGTTEWIFLIFSDTGATERSVFMTLMPSCLSGNSCSLGFPRCRRLSCEVTFLGQRERKEDLNKALHNTKAFMIKVGVFKSNFLTVLRWVNVKTNLLSKFLK